MLIHASKEKSVFSRARTLFRCRRTSPHPATTPSNQEAENRALYDALQLLKILQKHLRLPPERPGPVRPGKEIILRGFLGETESTGSWLLHDGPAQTEMTGSGVWLIKHS